MTILLDIPAPTTIHIYPQIAVIERVLGNCKTVYPVRLDGIAEALGRVSLMSGILPENTLLSGERDGKKMIIKYLQPCIRTLALGREGNHTFTIPMPPMIWAGWGRVYRLYALNQHTYPNASTILFHAPVPNLDSRGEVCWGDTGTVLDVSHAAMKTMLDRFFESNFVPHTDNHRSMKYPLSVLDMWHDLAKANAEHYPLTDLVAASIRLDQVIDEGWTR